MVSELRRLDLVAGEQEIELDRIPPEADLSSLVIRSRRTAVELLAWERRGKADVVHCRIRSSVTAPRVGVDVIYRVHGFGWTAHYEVIVRGEEEDEREPVSVDLRGMVCIVNNTSRTFSNALIRVEHQVLEESGVQPKGPGFLMLDRTSPLTDIWFDASPEEPIPYSYEVPGRIHLRAYSETEAPLINKVRTPAWRLYSMVAENFPMDARQYMPLRKHIAFRHEGEIRETVAMLPPGNVRIHVGAFRRNFLQEAHFKRTSPGDEIRVDLGPSEDVSGRRLARPRVVQPGYARGETYQISIRNERDTDIRLEIDEKPPVTLGWSLISSTLPCRQVSKRLQFSTFLGAGDSVDIEYRLRVSEPEI